jgi:hypothetical protein
LDKRKTGVMFTPDLVSAPTVSPWAGQGRSGEPARTARQRRVFILAQNDRRPYCPRNAIGLGAKSGWSNWSKRSVRPGACAELQAVVALQWMNRRVNHPHARLKGLHLRATCRLVDRVVHRGLIRGVAPALPHPGHPGVAGACKSVARPAAGMPQGSAGQGAGEGRVRA